MADFALPPQQVEELIRTIVKAVRAFQMYLPNNPIYQRSVEGLRAAFLPIWSTVPELTLKVVETDLHWDDHVVYHQPTKSDSFAWLLYKDGLRILTRQNFPNLPGADVGGSKVTEAGAAAIGAEQGMKFSWRK